jgi:hypothetical protein
LNTLFFIKEKTLQSIFLNILIILVKEKAVNTSITALIKHINILKDCVKVVTLNNPPYIPIPFTSALLNKLFKAKKLAKSKPIITILENNIDLSHLKVTAFETNKEINKEINICKYAIPKH